MKAYEFVRLLRVQAKRLRSCRQWTLTGEPGRQEYMDLHALADDLEALADLLEQSG